MKTDLDQNFWNTRWENRQTGWDIGYASPAITEYMAQYPDKDASILIPGCGNAYEAEFLVGSGFTDVTLVDISPKAVENLNQKFGDKPQVKAICKDFFGHQGEYDLMIEQTFFCALPPEKREDYVKKASSLLNKNGKIIGLLFDKNFDRQGPPFGGDSEEYKTIFEPYFHIKIMEKNKNSIPPRAGSEVFVEMVKK